MENLSNKIDASYSEKSLKYSISFHKFFKKFLWKYKDGKPRQSGRPFWDLNLENMQNYQYSWVKNSLLDLEKRFIGLKDRELRDRKEKN